MSSKSLYEGIQCFNSLSNSLGNVDNTFSVDADTGNLTMNKVATSPDSYLLQVMVSLMILHSAIQHSWPSREHQSCCARSQLH